MTISIDTPDQPSDGAGDEQPVRFSMRETDEGEVLVMGCMTCGRRQEIYVDEESGFHAAHFKWQHLVCFRESPPSLDVGWDEHIKCGVEKFLHSSAHNFMPLRSVLVVPRDLDRCGGSAHWLESCSSDSGRVEREYCRWTLENDGTPPDLVVLVQPETATRGLRSMRMSRVEVILLTPSSVQRFTVPRCAAEVWADQPWTFAQIARDEVANPMDRSLEGLIIEEIQPR